MDEMLKAGLLSDEKILWRGKPESFETLDKTYKKKFAVSAVIGLLITMATSILFFFAVRRSGASPKPLVILVILILCGIPAFNILGDASNLRKMEYVVTDHRLIILRDALRGMPYSAILEAVFREDPDGHVSLLCGSDALKAKPDKWREICIIGQNTPEGTDVCNRFVFYAPSDLNGLKAAVKRKLPLA